MINKLILMGRLTADPVFSQTPSGVSVCKFTVASNRNYKGQNGEQQADFINCVAWRGTAEFVSKYFNKGSMIIVEGSLQNNNYEKDGIKYYSYIVKADSVTFGESKSASNNSQSAENTQPPVQNNQNNGNSGVAAQNNDDLSIGDLSDFEEILSDGEVPF